MDFKTGKWAKNIIDLQQEDGSWGYFHSLSNPNSKQPMATEQALRRLEILGFTIEDRPIKRAVAYLNDCLTGKNRIPDREEKVHNWDIFTGLMLSAWIKRFTKENERVNEISKKWSEIVNASFSAQGYNHSEYVKTYERVFKTITNPKAGRLIDFVNFYPVSLLTNELDKKFEPYYFDYILNHAQGIYYVYDRKLTEVPKEFASKITSYFVRAIELLANYENPECKKKLNYVKTWLNENALSKNRWDMGKESKDGISFPLSDSWRNEENRIFDCTYRIQKILEKLS